MGPTTTILASVILYTIAVIIIGLVTARRIKHLDDFFIGGRRIGAWGTALAYQSTALSGWLYIAYAGLAYKYGPSHVAWLIIASGAAPLIAFLVLGKGLRKIAEETKAVTVIDWLERRYQDDTKVLRILSVAVIFICMMVYAAGQIMAVGAIMQVLLGVSYETGIYYSAAIIGIYVLLGGYLAVVTTDVIQGLVMFVTSLTLAILALIKVGGLSGLLSNLEAVDPTMVNVWAFPTVAIGYLVASWLGYLGQPQLVVRFMSAKGTKQILHSIPIVATVAPILLFGAGVAGSAARLLMPNLANPEHALLQLSVLVFHPVVAGVVLAGVLAAIMSSADQLVLSAVTSVVEDTYHRLIKPNASDKEIVNLARIVTVIIVVLATIIALNPFESVLWVMWWGWGGLTAFGPLFILGAYWKRVNKYGGILGLLMGFIASVIWFQLGYYKWLHLSAPAFAFSLLGCVIGSLLFKPKK